MKAKIVVENVGKRFKVRNTSGKSRKGNGSSPADELVALEDIYLDVEEGEFLVLVGPSGCGKSTLLDIIAGLTTPSSGRVYIDGMAIDGPALDRGMVFQAYAMFPWRTALSNVEFGLEAKGVPKRERTETARTYLALVGLSGFEDRYPHELSGGMRQRVAIARSLAYDPNILLMDEPFGALDEQTRETLQGELLRIWKETRKTVVFVTHSIDEAVFLGQRVAIMGARPGTIRHLVDISLGSQGDDDEDVRSSSQFVKTRHEVWSLLRDDVKPNLAVSETCASCRLDSGLAATSETGVGYVREKVVNR